jgi:hypothetical protein
MAETPTEIEKIKQELEWEKKIASDLIKEVDLERNRAEQWKFLSIVLLLLLLWLAADKVGLIRWLWAR